MNHQAVADEFLDQWEKAHSANSPDYDRLRMKFAMYTGQEVGVGMQPQSEQALHTGRKARGWPDPKPAPKGYMSIEPTIEGAIMSLWLSALRMRRRGEKRRQRDLRRCSDAGNTVKGNQTMFMINAPEDLQDRRYD